MVHSVIGEVVRKDDGRILLRLAGIVTLSITVPRSDDLKIGETVELFLWTRFQENKPPELFGFFSEEEREIFSIITRVQGLGPKTALLLLSALGPTGLLDAIATSDTELISSVKGIGKRKAELIVRALSMAGINSALAAASANEKLKSAVDALVAMGIDFGEAFKLATSAYDENSPLDGIIRKALSLRLGEQ